MINILYALNGPMYKGGTEAVVLTYYNNIDKSKFHIDFLIHGNAVDCKDNLIHKSISESGSKIFYVTPRGKNPLKNKKDLDTFFKNNKYDIVHSHMDAAGYYVLKVAKHNGVPVCISHSHNTGGKIINGGKLRSLVYTILLENARKKLPLFTDIRIACSKDAGKWLFGNNEFTIVNNAVDVEKFRFNNTVREQYRHGLNIEGKFVIAHVGRFTEQKNHELLIDIFRQYTFRRDNAILLLVGTGDLFETINNKVNELHLSSKVYFLGVRNDVNSLMQATDLFVLPSFHEGLPVVGVEAQTAGLPCLISSNVSRDLDLTDNIEFLSIDNNIEEWIDRIDYYYNCKINRQKGYSDIKKAGYNVEAIISKLEDIYIDSVSSIIK